MDLVAYSALKFFWLFVLEAAVCLGVSVYCSMKLRDGAWSVLGVVGGLIGGLPALMFAYAWARLQWSDDFGPFDTITSNGFLNQTDWARPIGLALVALALVLSRRPRSSRVV